MKICLVAVFAGYMISSTVVAQMVPPIGPDSVDTTSNIKVKVE